MNWGGYKQSREDRRLDMRAAGRILADILAPVPGKVRTSDADLLRMLEARQDSAGLEDREWLALVLRLRLLAEGPEPELLPCQPTRVFPGTPAKEAVLAGRVAGGEVLHHPGDLKVNDGILAAGESAGDVAGDDQGVAGDDKPPGPGPRPRRRPA